MALLKIDSSFLWSGVGGGEGETGEVDIVTIAIGDEGEDEDEVVEGALALPVLVFKDRVILNNR